MDLEADLIRALQNDEFELEYQPILDIEGGRIVGFEALLRWQHPARGQISPAQFIPFAEESGLIVPIGAWALEQACAAASRWPEELRVAVNVSARQIERSLLQTIAGSLSRSSLSPQRLEVEITESRSLCTNTNFALIDDLGPVDKVWQPYLCGCQGEECREGFSCLVVSGRDAPELLETVEHPLDAVSIFVNPKVAGRRVLSVGFWRNDRPDTVDQEFFTQEVTVVAFVGEEQPRLADRYRQQVRNGVVVRSLAACQDEAKRAALTVCSGVDFRRKAAA